MKNKKMLNKEKYQYKVEEQSMFDFSGVESYLNLQERSGWQLVCQYYQFPNTTSWVFRKLRE